MFFNTHRHIEDIELDVKNYVSYVPTCFKKCPLFVLNYFSKCLLRSCITDFILFPFHFFILN